MPFCAFRKPCKNACFSQGPFRRHRKNAVFSFRVFQICVNNALCGGNFSGHHVKLQGFEGPILVQQVFFLTQNSHFESLGPFETPFLDNFGSQNRIFGPLRDAFWSQNCPFGLLGELLGGILGATTAPNDPKLPQMSSRSPIFVPKLTKKYPLGCHFGP